MAFGPLFLHGPCIQNVQYPSLVPYAQPIENFPSFVVDKQVVLVVIVSLDLVLGFTFGLLD